MEAAEEVPGGGDAAGAVEGALLLRAVAAAELFDFVATLERGLGRRGGGGAAAAGDGGGDGFPVGGTKAAAAEAVPPGAEDVDEG